MSTPSEHDGAQNAGTEQLHEQIEQDRQALADTISALHSKTDVKGRVREKAAGAEIAAADLAGWVGRKAGSVPRLAKQATDTASEQVRDTVRNKVPEPVRSPMEQGLGVVRREPRIVLAALAALMAVIAVRRLRRNS